jgi:hypothetical protein
VALAVSDDIIEPGDHVQILEDYAAGVGGVPAELLDIGLDLRLVQQELARIGGRLKLTAEQAARSGWPTVQILHLQGEVETLAKIIDETILELIRKAAEVEANSEG